MALSPSGFISLALDGLRDMLASLSAFQSWVGAADAAEAKTRIHIYGVDADNDTMPYALLDTGDSLSGEADSTGARYHFLHTYQLLCRFVASVSPEYQSSERDAKLEFTNAIGAILAELETASASGANLAIEEWASTGPAIRSGPEDKKEGDYWFWDFSLTVRGL